MSSELDYNDANFFDPGPAENYSQGPKRADKIWHKKPYEKILNTSWDDQLPDGRHWHASSLCTDYNGFGHLIIFGGYSAKAHTGHGDVWAAFL